LFRLTLSRLELDVERNIVRNIERKTGWTAPDCAPQLAHDLSATRLCYTAATGRPKPHIGWMLFENDIQTVMFKVSLFKLTRRPELNLARTASLEAWPLGNILMLLMKPPTAQGGNALSFPHCGITKVGSRLVLVVN
jgi:hypothetical protein